MKDYYKILELPFGAASMEIKTAYRRLAFKFHPDKNLNNKYAEEKFKEITEAYTVLSNDNKRIIYHAEYNDFLNNRYVNRIPDTHYKRPPYYNPADIPKQPRGPATRYDDNLNGLRIAIIVIVVITCIFLFVKSIIEIRERQRKREEAIQQLNVITTKEKDTISKDEFYKIISQEFMLSGDSLLLNSNIDSLKHVFDSIIAAEHY